MSGKFDKLIKELHKTFPMPDPDREREFLDSLPPMEDKKERRFLMLYFGNRPLMYGLPALSMAAVMIVAGIGVYRGTRNRIPAVPPTETTTTTVTTVQTETTVSTDGTESTGTTGTTGTTSAETTGESTSSQLPASDPETSASQSTSTGYQTSGTSRQSSSASDTSGTTRPGPSGTTASETTGRSGETSRTTVTSGTTATTKRSTNTTQTTSRTSVSTTETTRETTVESTVPTEDATTLPTIATTTTAMTYTTTTGMTYTTTTPVHTTTTAATTLVQETTTTEATIWYTTMTTMTSMTAWTDATTGTATTATEILDLRVDPEWCYDEPERSYWIYERTAGGTQAPSDDALLTQAVQNARYVLQGNGFNPRYFQVEGYAFTQYDMIVYSSLCGDLAPGTLISVVMPGGYIQLSDYYYAHSDSVELYDDISDTNVYLRVSNDSVVREKVTSGDCWYALSRDADGRFRLWNNSKYSMTDDESKVRSILG